jgi:hypothetical protein
MNYGELKAAVLSDSQRADYASIVARLVNEGEALISANLDGYFLETTIAETNRVSGPIYSLPAKVSTMRHVIYLNNPLVQVDETLVSQYRTLAEVCVYCMRDTRIVFGGIPPVNAVFSLNYFGLPALLANDTDTNNLLTDYPQLYKEAAQVSLFKRARNFQAADTAMGSVQFLIKQINIKTKRKLAGAQSANAYNVSFRSSY